MHQIELLTDKVEPNEDYMLISSGRILARKIQSCRALIAGDLGHVATTSA
jgi:hypothetical protein